MDEIEDVKRNVDCAWVVWDELKKWKTNNKISIYMWIFSVAKKSEKSRQKNFLIIYNINPNVDMKTNPNLNQWS